MRDGYRNPILPNQYEHDMISRFCNITPSILSDPPQTSIPSETRIDQSQFPVIFSTFSTFSSHSINYQPVATMPLIPFPLITQSSIANQCATVPLIVLVAGRVPSRGGAVGHVLAGAWSAHPFTERRERGRSGRRARCGCGLRVRRNR